MKKNDLVNEFAKSMIKTHAKFKAFLRDKFKENNINLTFEMLQVLAKLWNNDRINQQELANYLFKDKTSLTYLIDNLSKRSLVQRVEDATDRRNKLIVLKPKGQKLKEIIMPWVDEMYSIAGEGIPAEDFNKSMEIFEKISYNLNKQLV